MSVEVERWVSNDNDEEIHFFEKGKSRGNAYVFGFNPKYIPKEKAEAFLRSLGLEPPDET